MPTRSEGILPSIGNRTTDLTQSEIRRKARPLRQFSRTYSRTCTGNSVMPRMKLELRYSGSPTTSTSLNRFKISSQMIRSCISASRLPKQR